MLRLALSNAPFEQRRDDFLAVVIGIVDTIQRVSVVAPFHLAHIVRDVRILVELSAAQLQAEHAARAELAHIPHRAQAKAHEKALIIGRPCATHRIIVAFDDGEIAQFMAFAPHQKVPAAADEHGAFIERPCHIRIVKCARPQRALRLVVAQ